MVSQNLEFRSNISGVGESIDDLQKFDADEFVNGLFYSDSKTEETEEQKYVKTTEEGWKMLTLGKFEGNE